MKPALFFDPLHALRLLALGVFVGAAVAYAFNASKSALENEYALLSDKALSEKWKANLHDRLTYGQCMQDELFESVKRGQAITLQSYDLSDSVCTMIRDIAIQHHTELTP